MSFACKNISLLLTITSGKSLINHTKRRNTRTGPRGTPLITLFQSVISPFVIILCKFFFYFYSKAISFHVLHDNGLHYFANYIGLADMTVLGSLQSPFLKIAVMSSFFHLLGTYPLLEWYLMQDFQWSHNLILNFVDNSRLETTWAWRFDSF